MDANASGVCDELKTAEFRQRLAAAPIAYLPIGLLDLIVEDEMVNRAGVGLLSETAAAFLSDPQLVLLRGLQLWQAVALLLVLGAASVDDVALPVLDSFILVPIL